MIIGIGTDIQAIARVKEAIERSGEAFLKKVFSGEETAYCRTKRHWAQHFAVRFCAKEAFLKALGTGWSQGIRWIEVVVSKNGAGCPQIRLSGRAAELAASRGVDKIWVTLAHSDGYATATVILEAQP